MTAPRNSPAAASIPTELARELERVSGSSVFAPSRRHQKLLRHLVERTAAGDTAALKESVLALEFFELPAASFDPRRDTIVRVEARRLRQRLQRYYAGEGANAALRIELPVGSYVPVWRQRSAAPELRQGTADELLAHALAAIRAALRHDPAQPETLAFLAAMRRRCAPQAHDAALLPGA